MLNLKDEEERQRLAEKIAEKEAPLPEGEDQRALKLTQFARQQKAAIFSAMDLALLRTLAKSYGIDS